MNPFFVILGIVATFIVALVYFSQPAPRAEAPIEVPSQYETRLIELDRGAIEAAYQQHVQSVFLTWMKDSTGQPERAVRGVNVARKAYTASMDKIEERMKKQRVEP